MIQNDTELKASQQRLVYFQDLLMQLRVNATPEEFVYVSSGYRMEIAKMQKEVLDYLTQHSAEPIQIDGALSQTEEMLTQPGECLDIEIETLPVVSNVEEIVKSTKQERLNLTFNFAEGPKTQAPIVFLSNVFGKLQAVINTIGIVCQNSSKGAEEIKDSMQISLFQVSPGSFNIHLVSPEITQLNFFDNYECGDAIEKFFELLNAENDQNELKGLLGQLKLRVAKNYADFMKSLRESVIDTRFTWKSPNPDRGGTAYLSNSQMEEVIDILEQFQEEDPSRITITGILIAANLRTNRFEIKTDNKNYTGDIAEEFFENVDNITLNLEYTAEIQEITERSEATGELTKPKYLLLSLNR